MGRAPSRQLPPCVVHGADEPTGIRSYTGARWNMRSQRPGDTASGTLYQGSRHSLRLFLFFSSNQIVGSGLQGLLGISRISQ